LQKKVSLPSNFYGQAFKDKYLLSFELSAKDSKAREEELAEELESTYIVYGGH